MSKNSPRQNTRQIDIWRDWFMKSFRKPVKQNTKFGKRR